MEYLAQKPTEPGWYWHRDAKSEHGDTIARIDRRGRTKDGFPDGTYLVACFMGKNRTYVLAEEFWYEGSLWAGPIYPPESQ